MSPDDAQHVKNLLDIVEACAGHSGKLAAISNEAMAELLGMNREMRATAMHAATQARIAEAEAAGQTGNTELAEGEVIEPPEVEEPAEEETVDSRNERLRREMEARRQQQAANEADGARR